MPHVSVLADSGREPRRLDSRSGILSRHRKRRPGPNQNSSGDRKGTPQSFPDLELFLRHEIHLDPILAYDRIAPEFGSLSDHRRAYLAAIEQLVIDNVPQGSCSLLDIGSGDGARAVRIAHAAAVKKLVLLEPSAEMRKKWPNDAQGWAIRAEELSEKNDSFDVITCLWNVLGHIFPSRSRIHVMRQCARLLSPEGRMFIDVNYRYNALHYGFLPTLVRGFRDRLRPGQENGDVIVRWTFDETSYTTDGHVFTQAEFRRLTAAAGLLIERKITINYSTGRIRPWSFAGNPLYMLRRASLSADSKVRQTS